MQTPDRYALERLSDEEFWDLAFAKANSALQVHSSFPHPSSNTTSTQQKLQELRMSNDASSDASMIYVVCDDTYAFPLVALHEIVPLPKQTTLLPNTPHWMLGLNTWQGHILPTIDLHAYLTNTSIITTEHSLLVAHHDTKLLAFAAKVGQSVSVLDRHYTILDITILFEDIVQCLGKQVSDE